MCFHECLLPLMCFHECLLPLMCFHECTRTVERPNMHVPRRCRRCGTTWRPGCWRCSKHQMYARRRCGARQALARWAGVVWVGHAGLLAASLPWARHTFCQVLSNNFSLALLVLAAVADKHSCRSQWRVLPCHATHCAAFCVSLSEA